MSSSNLNMVEAKLPPGFRFHPRDDELICDYLMKKVTRCEQPPLLIEVDLNKSEPWDIPESASVGGKEWYFYSQRDRKYATGLRTNRATVSGYWKATGKDRPVGRKGTLVGMRKTLVFYQGRAPKGKKTDWVMHEFRLEGPLGPPKLSASKEDWVLCRAFYKSRLEVSAKQGVGNFYAYDDTRSTSSSLPALTDPYNITFDQTPESIITNDQFEQVPCFSIFAPNPNPNPTQTYCPTFFHTITTHMEPPNVSAKLTSPTLGGTMPDLLGSYLNPTSSSSCEKKVIDAVLSHLTKLENSSIINDPKVKESPCSFGEGSSESFLSEVGFPTMWSHY